MDVLSFGDAIGLTIGGAMVALIAAGFAYHYPDGPGVTAGISAVVAVGFVMTTLRNDPLDRWIGASVVLLPWSIVGALAGTLGGRRDRR